MFDSTVSMSLPGTLPKLRRSAAQALLFSFAMVTGFALFWWQHHREVQIAYVRPSITTHSVSTYAQPQAAPRATTKRAPAPETARVEPQPSAPPPGGVQRDGETWRIEAQSVSRAQLAQQLAQASGSQLNAEAIAWFQQAAPLSGHWQGLSLRAAWQGLLGDQVHYALRCGTQRCALWVAGASAAPSAGSGRMPMPINAPAEIAVMATDYPVMLPPSVSEQPTPNVSEQPTASVSEPLTALAPSLAEAAAPMQVDPPELLPSE